jgi:hypothetical protein
MRGDDLSGGDFERGKQRRGAVALIVVALAGQSASVWQLQITLRALQRLNRRLFVDAQDNGLCRRSNVEADNIGGFGRKLRIVALAPGFASRKGDLVAAQESPDILDVDIAKFPGQQQGYRMFRSISTRKLSSQAARLSLPRNEVFVSG